MSMALARTVGDLTGAGLLAWAAWRWWRGLSDQARQGATVSRRLAKFGLAAMMSMAAGTAISQIDVLIVGLERHSSAAALYAPASRVADFAVSFPPLIGGFLLPALAAAISRGDRHDAARLYHWSSRWSFVLCAPVIGLMLAAPGAFLHLLFGAAYVHVAEPLRIMGLGVAVHVALGFNGLTLDAHGVPGAVAVRGGIGIVASLVGSLVLVPSFGLAGAAAATGGALVLVNILCSATLWRRFGTLPWDRGQLLTLAAFGAAALASWAAFDHGGGPTLTTLVVGAICGVVTLLAALWGGGADERSAIRAAIRARFSRS
jgi:O-antigen/teichoic acid export membrane protein